MDMESNPTQQGGTARWCWCVLAHDGSVALRTWSTLKHRLNSLGAAATTTIVTSHAASRTLEADVPPGLLIGTAASDSWGALAVAVDAAHERGCDAVIIVPADVVIDLDLAAFSDMCTDVGDDLVRPLSSDDSSANAFDDPALPFSNRRRPLREPMIVGSRRPLVIEPRLVGPGGWHAVEQALASRGGVARDDARLRGTDVSPGDALFDAHPWHQHLRNDLIVDAPTPVEVDPGIRRAVAATTNVERNSPWWFFDSIVAINLARQIERRRMTQIRCDVQGFGHRVAWFPAIESVHQIPEAILLSHRAVIEDAARRNVEHLLILEDDVVFASDAQTQLLLLLDQLPEVWDLGYLGGIAPDVATQQMESPGGPLAPGVGVYTTHAYCVHRRAYDQLLHALPDTFAGADEFIAGYGPIDNWYATHVASGRLVGWLAVPQIAVQADQLSRHKVDLEPTGWGRFLS
jgi:hypothetical protein